jgi:hypothetical protein
MTLRTTYVVQTFEIHRKRLVPTTKSQSKSELSAVRSAESVAQSKSGAAALEIIADDETGELSSARVIAKFGDVPDDFEELLRG